MVDKRYAPTGGFHCTTCGRWNLPGYAMIQSGKNRPFIRCGFCARAYDEIGEGRWSDGIHTIICCPMRERSPEDDFEAQEEARAIKEESGA